MPSVAPRLPGASPCASRSAVMDPVAPPAPMDPDDRHGPGGPGGPDGDGGPPMPAPPGHEPPDGSGQNQIIKRDDAVAKILATLTPTQRDAWNTLTGDRFDGIASIEFGPSGPDPAATATGMQIAVVRDTTALDTTAWAPAARVTTALTWRSRSPRTRWTRLRPTSRRAPRSLRRPGQGRQPSNGGGQGRAMRSLKRFEEKSRRLRRRRSVALVN